MKQIGNTIGGWMWYVEQVKTVVKRDLVKKDYQDLMQNYGTGVPWEKAASELPLEAPVEPPQKKKR